MQAYVGDQREEQDERIDALTSWRTVIVDDHPDVRAVVAAILSVDGRFEVVGEAADGKEAVDAVAASAPDLVLLDLAMPVMDGLQALPLIKAAAPGVAVIVLSGFGTDQTVRAALASGADAFLPKGADLVDGLVATCLEVLRDRPPSTGPASRPASHV